MVGRHVRRRPSWEALIRKKKKVSDGCSVIALFGDCFSLVKKSQDFFFFLND